MRRGIRRLYLVRHGRTIWNEEGRFQGQTDIPLSPEGREQARLLARRLQRLPFREVFASDLSRARETGEIIASTLGIPLHLRREWREMDYGLWAGLSFEEIQEKFPRETEAYLEDWVHVAPPGGESFRQLTERVRGALQEVLGRPAEHLLVVAHGGTIRAAVCLLLGLDPLFRRLFTLGNAALVELEVGEKEARLVRWNDTCHLEEDGSRARNT